MARKPANFESLKGEKVECIDAMPGYVPLGMTGKIKDHIHRGDGNLYGVEFKNGCYLLFGQAAFDNLLKLI